MMWIGILFVYIVIPILIIILYYIFQSMKDTYIYKIICQKLQIYSDDIFNSLFIILIMCVLFYVPLASNVLSMNTALDNESVTSVVHQYKHLHHNIKINKNKSSSKYHLIKYRITPTHIHQLKRGTISRSNFNVMINGLHVNSEKRIILNILTFSFAVLFIIYLIVFIGYTFYVLCQYHKLVTFHIFIKYDFNLSSFLLNSINEFAKQVLQLIAIYSIILNFGNILFNDTLLGTNLILWIPPLVYFLISLQTIIFMHRYQRYYSNQIWLHLLNYNMS